MGAKYQAYQDYKNSDVDLLMDVPTHWIVGRYKFCTDRIVVGIAEAATHAYADEGVPIIRSTNIREGGLDTNGLLFIKSEFAEKNDSKYLYENDIITVRTGYPGVSSVIPKYLNKSQCFTNLVATPKNVFVPEFLAHYLNSHAGKEYFDLLGWGSAQKNISVPILQNIPIAYPSKNEQEIIVNFLDHETAKIDTLIEKQQQLIKLLKEKRQAVISHAVTKGLNPNAPMRDSGVEWLGEVPEHWEGAVIRRYLLEHRQGYYTTDAYVDDGTKLLRITDLKALGEISISDCPKVPYSDTLKNYLLEKGDVVFARTGGAGSFGVIPKLTEEVAYASYLIRFRFLPKHFNTDYLRFMLIADSFQLAVKSNIHGGVTQNIHAEDIKDTFVASPPLEEQKEISLYLDKQSDKYAELINKADLAIQLMQERRTALISAAVTGKIDVRHFNPEDGQAPDSSNANNKEVAA